MIEHRSASGKLIPWPPRNVPHEPSAMICTCDDCELPRYEAWADKIDGDHDGSAAGAGILLAILAVIGLVAVIWASL